MWMTTILNQFKEHGEQKHFSADDFFMWQHDERAEVTHNLGVPSWSHFGVRDLKKLKKDCGY